MTEIAPSKITAGLKVSAFKKSAFASTTYYFFTEDKQKNEGRGVK